MAFNLRFFTVHTDLVFVDQQKLWSDCTAVQADLSHCCLPVHSAPFLKSQLVADIRHFINFSVQGSVGKNRKLYVYFL